MDFSTQRKSVKVKEDENRRALAIKALDYYNNQQLVYLLDRIASLYPNEKDVMQKYAYCYPLTRNLINDIAIAFQEPCEIIPDTENQNILDRWQEVALGSRLQSTLILTDRMVELLGKVGICPRWHTELDYIVLDILTPDRTVVTQDPQDHTRAIEVRYIISETTNTVNQGEVTTWAIWTRDAYTEAELFSNGDISKTLKSEPNPYGEIPIAWFTNSQELDEFWHDSGYPIIETNETVNIRLSNLMLALDYQTVSLLVTIGMPASQSIPIGVTQRLNIPAGEIGQGLAGYDAKYITPSPLLRDVWDLINQLILNVAKLYGLSAQSYNRDSSAFASGYQLKLSKQDIVNRNKLKREFYRQSIKDLCRYMMMCYTTNSDFNFYETAVNIDFGDIQFETNPIEQAQLNAIELGNGITSEVQILMDRNPDLTEEDAIALFAKYREHRSKVGTLSTTAIADGMGLNEQL